MGVKASSPPVPKEPGGCDSPAAFASRTAQVHVASETRSSPTPATAISLVRASPVALVGRSRQDSDVTKGVFDARRRGSHKSCFCYVSEGDGRVGFAVDRQSSYGGGWSVRETGQTLKGDRCRGGGGK